MNFNIPKSPKINLYGEAIMKDMMSHDETDYLIMKSNMINPLLARLFTRIIMIENHPDFAAWDFLDDNEHD